MRRQLQELLEKNIQLCVSNVRNSNHSNIKIERKKEALLNRNAEILKVKAIGHINQIETINDEVVEVTYEAHYQYLIRQKKQMYVEEEVELRQAEFYKGILVDDEEINPLAIKETLTPEKLLTDTRELDERVSFKYNRLKAVQYAERWWNDYNPAYKKFEVDCTNYISQCLHAGGAPVRGYPNRGKGWWMQNNNWSYSWSVANSLRLYLSNSTIGLRAKEVSSPDQLILGDVICYDFEGDGRYNHNTIVTGKDANGMPLVNAHTYNSRMRYWAYEDSSAYTPNIKYRFFTIVDDD
jgi:hypothetical protein